MFEEELEQYKVGMIAVSVTGDLNIHHKEWLKYSSHTTKDGEFMYQMAKKHQLKQHVKEPTRGDHLLDLFLSSAHGASAHALPKVADHAAVLVSIVFSYSRPTMVHREVWDYKRAAWGQLRRHLEQIQWHEVLTGNVDAVANHLVNIILDAAKQFIPKRQLSELKCSHP